LRMASACSTVASMSWVRVAHMLWTATACSEPSTTEPIRTVARRISLHAAFHRSRGGAPSGVHPSASSARTPRRIGHQEDRG
jgi:hypothetical protein